MLHLSFRFRDGIGGRLGWNARKRPLTGKFASERVWDVAAWHELRSAQPELAAAGRDLLYPHGMGLGFLATVRPDGGPRLHPMWPLLTDDELFAFIIPSPKQADLRRDGRYVLHSLPREDNEDTFSISGHAWLKEDPSTRRSLEEQFVREHEALGVPTPDPNDALFRFDIESCVLTRASGRGDFTPSHKVWRP
jgi:hypothetical protein